MRPRVSVDIGPMMERHEHGVHAKSLIVCHETISHDVDGLADGNAVASYLAAKDYGIHGIIDREGHLWWAVGLSRAVFYHCASAGSHGDGMVNSRGIGIELVSYPWGSRPQRFRQWLARERQMHELARVIEWQAHHHGIPLHYSDGRHPGVTTHWSVSQTYGVEGGHTDCHPRHLGGYFPVRRILRYARAYRAARIRRRR